MNSHTFETPTFVNAMDGMNWPDNQVLTETTTNSHPTWPSADRVIAGAGNFENHAQTLLNANSWPIQFSGVVPNEQSASLPSPQSLPPSSPQSVDPFGMMSASSLSPPACQSQETTWSTIDSSQQSAALGILLESFFQAGADSSVQSPLLSQQNQMLMIGDESGIHNQAGLNVAAISPTITGTTPTTPIDEMTATMLAGIHNDSVNHNENKDASQMPASESMLNVMQHIPVQQNPIALEMARAAALAQLQQTNQSSSPSPHLLSQSQPMPVLSPPPFHPLVLYQSHNMQIPVMQSGSPPNYCHMPIPTGQQSPTAVAPNRAGHDQLPQLRMQSAPDQINTATIPGSLFNVPTVASTMQPGFHMTESTGLSPLSPQDHAFMESPSTMNSVQRGPNHRPFVCLDCKKRFARPSALRLHMRTHSGERPHACQHPGCGRRFSVQSNLTRHLRLHARKGGFSPRDQHRGTLAGVTVPKSSTPRAKSVAQSGN